MKISYQWLREWVASKLGAVELAERLTLAGLEVGGVYTVSDRLERVVVGIIETVAPHPRSDRLHVCQVNVGSNKMLTIVCGADNAAPGIRVPTALEGAILPNGKAIAASTIQGITSSGMLCSAAELGLEEMSTGLMVLDESARAGVSLMEVLQLDDRVLEVELTPNRGDCLSVMGLARDVAALTGSRLTPANIRTLPVKSHRHVRVRLSAKSACAHYAGRVIEGINPQARTPMWMRERLRRAGIRSIHPVVDITNYVMMELGQPMHAFDLERLAGAITVRQAVKDETIVLLDGKTLTLDTSDLVIADERAAIALAGIMGGQGSAVSANTVNLFLESAWFRPEPIGLRARHHGLHSESSHRFERGVDPRLQRQALDRAAGLILGICGGRAGAVTEASARAQLPKRPALTLRPHRIERILGLPIPATHVTGILKRLGMHVVRSRTKAGTVWQVTPPSWRYDIMREVDLIEELARVHGYDKIPVHMPRMTLQVPSLPESRISERRLRQLLVDRDYQEVITYSFVDPATHAVLAPSTPKLVLSNPIASDLAEMRASLWPGLVQAVRFNLNRQQTRIRMFEIGRRFLPATTGTTVEQKTLAGIVCGPAQAEQWGAPSRDADFFDVKADVEMLLNIGKSPYTFRRTSHPALHPGQSAEILRESDNNPIGSVGVLHPETQRKLGLDCSVILFELNLDALMSGIIPEFREISRFPAVRRDIAMVLDMAVPAADVIDMVRKSAGPLLTNLELFDVYRGEGIDSGRKSLALALTFQDTSRTLSNEDVEAVVGRVVAALQAGLGAQPRQ